jgi:hypothetical protein
LGSDVGPMLLPIATTTRFALLVGVPQTPGVGDVVEEDVGVGIGPFPPPPRSSFAHAAKAATIVTAIQYRVSLRCIIGFAILRG